MKETTLEDRFEIVKSALIKGETTEQIAGELAFIPMRDAVLRFAFDAPELRSVLISSLDELIHLEISREELTTIYTILAGIYFLNADIEETQNLVNDALSLDSGYSLARLLDTALRHGVPAFVWSDSLKAVSYKQIWASV
jgi:hypothetical protein